MRKRVAAGCRSVGLAVGLSLSGQGVSALPEPVAPQANHDWTAGNVYANSLYALGVSQWNFVQYYAEAKARYGALPPDDQLARAAAGWDRYISSNLPGISTYIVNNNPPDHGGGWTVDTPLIPLVNRVVTPVNADEGFRRPLLPPMRLTHDGRIGVVPGSGGLDGNPQPLRIRLNRPEVLTTHFLRSRAGVPTLDPDTWLVSDHRTWGMKDSKTTHFVSICEGQPKTPADRNPYACGVNGQDDCYTLTLVGSAVKDTFSTSALYNLPGGYRTLYMPQLEKEDRLYSRGMVVRVSRPKTAQARIADVSFTDDYREAPIRQGILFELNTPADGRLLVTRRQGLPLVWRHAGTGQLRAGSYEMVYAVAPKDADPCDVTRWGDLKPLSHAPFDPEVRDRYDFARYPFRDPMGNPVADGEDIKGTYPWVDKDAKNMELMISDANLFRDGLLFDSSRFPNRCVKAGCTPGDSPDKSNISQFTLMGAWTKGKMVVIDNRLNYADFRINLANALYLDLYQPGSALPATANTSASVEVGAYREVGGGTVRDQYIPLKDAQGNPLYGSDGRQQTYLMKNSSLFDSIENRMNANPRLKPVSPHDVVWLLSSGATSDEFAFDDLLNNQAFILSDMVAAYSWVNDNPFRMTGYDGWNELYGSWRGQVKVQNAATTLPDRWRVPAAGDVVNGRIEPVGNGGIKGKGLFFNGRNTRIRYDIPAGQPRPMDSAAWFHSLFLDARDLDAGGERVILDFPDKSRLTLSGTGGDAALRAYNNFGELQQTVALPSGLVRERWLQLGIQRAADGRITISVNGYPYTEFTAAADGGSLFRMTGGALVLGRAENTYDTRYANWFFRLLGLSTATSAEYGAFKGWMDEYKVFAEEPDPESACNLAHGTLMATGSDPQLAALSRLYPPAMHDRISAALQLRGQPVYAAYACYQDAPGEDRTATLDTLPADGISLRAALHFPEGPLYHDAPRPDTSTNPFCLGCHAGNEAGERIPGLTVRALIRNGGVAAKADPRRQPTQALPIISGNVPAEFLASIGANPGVAGTAFMDEYLLPGSRGVSPDIRNLVAVRNGQPVRVASNGVTLSRSGFGSLRLNTSGLTATAVFEVNGAGGITDATAPFELPAALLANGVNRISVRTCGINGQQSQRTFSVTVGP